MARREILMEELIEVHYQWHMGRNISQIKRSLGMAWKNIRKCVELAEKQGFSLVLGVLVGVQVLGGCHCSSPASLRVKMAKSEVVGQGF